MYKSYYLMLAAGKIAYLVDKAQMELIIEENQNNELLLIVSSIPLDYVVQQVKIHYWVKSLPGYYVFPLQSRYLRNFIQRVKSDSFKRGELYMDKELVFEIDQIVINPLNDPDFLTRWKNVPPVLTEK